MVDMRNSITLKIRYKMIPRNSIDHVIVEEEKDTLVTAMPMLVKDLNHKGSVINANHNKEMEQRCPQMANCIQQTNKVINPSINLI
jgi:mannose-1-phosphate guanylyltransferase